jgi:hypothetical protein
MGDQSMPIWPLSGGREGLSGGQAARPTDNPDYLFDFESLGYLLVEKLGITQVSHEYYITWVLHKYHPNII